MSGTCLALAEKKHNCIQREGALQVMLAKMWPFGSSNVAGPSNSDLYRDLRTKDEQLQSKDYELKELLRAKEEQLKAKDAELKELLRAKEGQLERKDAQLERKDEQLERKDADWKKQCASKERIMKELNEVSILLIKANDIVLGLRERRNVRGALEYIAGDLIDGRGGVQNKLDLLADDAEFMEAVQAIAHKQNLRLLDVKRCLKGLYHTYSKTMHGSEAVVTVRVTAMSAETEVAVLMALFDKYGIAYDLQRDA